ncbi:MAG: serine/threonine protein kinase, partial [Nocardiaceae bacterium]|nr:serine/threonine protein kinase [Nocardiaceae bacterium]
QTLAQLDHDYIVRVFDQRIVPGTGLRLLYMQYLSGGTLHNLLHRVREYEPENRSGQLLLDSIDASLRSRAEIRPSESQTRALVASLSWPETVAWLGRRLAEALDYADKVGVLHRDIKPANILLSSEGVPKLADFNISFARSIGNTSPVAYFGGSLAYMSPEQLEACHPDHLRSAGDLDTRSDLYSLGVVLWELLTGTRPFTDRSQTSTDGSELVAMLNLRVRGVPDSAIDALPEDCPTALRRILLKCLAPDREDRFARGKELAQQLDMVLDEHARELVDPPAESWRKRLRAWSIPVVALAAGVPNGLASLYNIQYNQVLIVNRLPPDAQTRFLLITAIINGIFFPVGIGVLIYISRFMLRVPYGLRHGKTFPPEVIARARSDSLITADRVAAVALGLWLLAGLLFPLTLELSTGSIDWKAAFHFFASLAVCGSMAVAYPFFMVSFFVVRSLYPELLPYSRDTSGDRQKLASLRRRSVVYLCVAASVPLVGVTGLSFIPVADLPEMVLSVRILSIGGILAFIAAYYLFRQTEEDLSALQRVVA